MKISITIILIVIALLIGVVAGYAVPRPTAPAATVTITQTVTTTAPTAVGLSGDVPIGALLPLTGALATYGKMCQEAFMMAVEDVNSWLAAMGKPWRLKPFVEDTAVDPKLAVDKFMTLIGRGVKVVVGPMASSEVKAIRDYANERKVVIISQSSTSMELALPNDFVLRFTAPDKYQGVAIAHILWERGVRYVIPIWRGDTWGDGLLNYTKAEFVKICRASGEPCGFDDGIRYAPEAKEFSVEVSRLASITRDYIARYGREKVGILAISFEEIASIFTEAVNYPELSQVKWQGSDGTYGSGKLVEDPRLAEFTARIEFWNTMTATGESPIKESFRRRLMNRIGGVDPIPYAYFTYDIVWAVALTINNVGSYDGEAIRFNIIPILNNFIGVSGYITLDENGDRASTDYVIAAVVEEGGKYLWKDIGGYIGGKLVIY
ncbi:MAG: penicillin-binding protein activator [Ignisphaera sp.]|nr:penicillin-binding protein activator [Ignisphaera sp.]MCX8167586.1 penicillin-binding protein activator [Ignisphaera sp.]MDW8085406.1 penicillin-binding protein activator [Ignisphaera sp.]